FSNADAQRQCERQRDLRSPAGVAETDHNHLATISRGSLRQSSTCKESATQRSKRQAATDLASELPIRWSDAAVGIHPPRWYWTMRAKSSGSRLAPPTRTPSMSGWAIRSAMFSG